MKKLLSLLLVAALLMASGCQAPPAEEDTTFYDEVNRLVTEDPPKEVLEEGSAPEDCRILVWSRNVTPDLWSLNPITVLTRGALAVLQFTSSSDALAAVETLCAQDGVIAAVDSPLEVGTAPEPSSPDNGTLPSQSSSQYGPDDQSAPSESSSSADGSQAGTTGNAQGEGNEEEEGWTSFLNWGTEYSGFRDFAKKAGSFAHVPTVAVLDTGVEFSHPRLSSLVDEARSLNLSSSPSKADVFGHGTHVAGIIADAVGDTPIRIISCKALGDDGTGNQVSAASAVLYAMEQGCDVMNLSFGGPHNVVLDEAIATAAAQGCQVVCSAGNNGWYIEERHNCPSHINSDTLLVVGSAGRTGERSEFSNYGPSVDLMAPGENINSTYLDGSYKSLSGTSMACPMVTGAVALMKACNPSLTPQTIEAMLKVSLNEAGVLDLRLLDPAALNPVSTDEPEEQPGTEQDPGSESTPEPTIPMPPAWNPSTEPADGSSSGSSSEPDTPPEPESGYVVSRSIVYLNEEGLYTGFWSNGQPEGMGKIVFLSETARFRSLDGVWNGGEFMVGTGIMDLPAGVYEGGVLRMTNPDGSAQHVQHGTGKITQPDGSVYDIIYNLGQELYSSQPTMS